MNSEEATLIYSPSAVLNLFSAAISFPQTKRLIQLRGVFVAGKGSNYSGFYYDLLRDEASDAQLTVIIPALIRNELQANKTVTFNGYVIKRVVANAGRIDIQLTVTELVEQTVNKYTDDDLKRVELLQRKADVGYHDVHAWIKEQIINERPFKTAIMIGKNAIIDNDIKHQLRESLGFYNIDFRRINLSSEAEIISAVKAADQQGIELIVVSRGGGENLEVFNKVAIVERCIGLNGLFVTAIGHKDDVTLLQRIADKAFITPSELGQFLNDTYNQTIAELQNSRAKLVESVKSTLAANYQKQIDNLNEKLKALDELKSKAADDMGRVHQEKVNMMTAQIYTVTKNLNDQITAAKKIENDKIAALGLQMQAYKAQISSLENKSGFSWAAVIIGIILGLIIGVALKGH